MSSVDGLVAEVPGVELLLADVRRVGEVPEVVLDEPEDRVGDHVVEAVVGLGVAADQQHAVVDAVDRELDGAAAFLGDGHVLVGHRRGDPERVAVGDQAGQRRDQPAAAAAHGALSPLVKLKLGRASVGDDYQRVAVGHVVHPTPRPDLRCQCGANSTEPSSGGAGGGDEGTSGSASGTAKGWAGLAVGSCRGVGVSGLRCALLRAEGRCVTDFEDPPSAAFARRRTPPPRATRPRCGRARGGSGSRETVSTTRGRPTSGGSLGGSEGMNSSGPIRRATSMRAKASTPAPACDQRTLSFMAS